MENHEFSKQMIEINSDNQGTEFISQQMVQEIIVQNDNNQQPTVNCEMSGIEIILPNDCVNVQNQCNSNIVLTANVNNEDIHEKQVTSDIPQINNLEGNPLNYNQSHSEEQYLIQNSETYQETYGTSDTVVLIENTENGGKETTSENSFSNKKVDEPVPKHVNSQTTGSLDSSHNCQSIVDQFSGTEEKDVSENEFTDSKGESISSTVADEHIQTREVDTISTVTSVDNGNVMVETHNQSQNLCSNSGLVEKTDYPNNGDSHYNEVIIHSKTSEVIEESEILATEQSKVASNSDDVAILTELAQQNYKESEEIVQSNEVDCSYETETVEQKDESIKKETEKVIIDSAENLPTKTMEEEMKNTNDSFVHEDLIEDDDPRLHLSSQPSENQRKVIQDIFDDWQDENVDEDNNQTDHQDSVELELQNLLNDGAQDTPSNIIMTSSLNNLETYPNSNKSIESTSMRQKNIKAEKSSTTSRRPSNRSPKPTPPKDQSLNRSKPHNQSESKQKHQSPRLGVKVPGSHLTSQIASTAEVSEVLKERLREKQKDLQRDPPKTADMVFVKKITARLSSKLANAITSTVPPPIHPIPENEGVKLDKSVESSKTSVTDNKELLAILEGDDDPDWPELKSSAEENSKTLSPGNSHHGSKMDSNREKELALKQLEELPSLPSKKNSSGASKKTKKTPKSNQLDEMSEFCAVHEEKVTVETLSSAESGEEDTLKKEKVSKAPKEKVQNDNVELNVEESRSGRKRKLTEKARQHELSVKRQKTVKGKTTEVKKKESSQEPSDTVVEESKPLSPKPDKVKLDTKSSIDSKTTKPETKQSKETNSEPSSDDENNSEVKTHAGKNKSQKQLGVSKKDAPISKRKLAVKNLMRQKMTGKKGKGKIQTEPLTKDSVPTKASSEKSTTGATVSRPKKSSEIDKLLQDEGVVNLLYDVEQPDSRRLVPITKSQKKVMDVDKAERELKLRTKLVRNAVMRLRNSNTSTIKISPRSRRSAVQPPQQKSPQAEKKSSEPAKSPKNSTSTPPSDFMLPGKTQRNAADASRIIRRHSSSSFSSASASPRVSVDMPPESIKIDFPETQIKTKRKSLQDSDEKLEKKTKKKSISQTDESDEDAKPPKKESVKKSKSNAAAATKVTPKNKKVPKSRSSLDLNSSDGLSRSPEKITACLAEAASALSTFASHLSNTSTNRKKGVANLSETEDKKLDVEKLSSAFTEINFQQHGHIVQLIVTPTTTTPGIKAALTIQAMKEIREALIILEKLDDCRVVLYTSAGDSFCEGIDLSFLVCSNEEDRKRRAEEMAKTVQAFIKTLSDFNKPIVAGVQGSVIGIGVTMLPLFDLVMINDNATFSTPYTRIGQVPEGGGAVTLLHSLGAALTSQMLFGGRHLKASEALKFGFITKASWPGKFLLEMLPYCLPMSQQSPKSLEATKTSLRRTLRKQLDTALESETFQLVEHWCTSECQEAIKAYIEERIKEHAKNKEKNII